MDTGTYRKGYQDTMIDTLGYHRSEAALYGRFIKYSRLNQLLELVMPTVPKEVNVYIDLTQMLMPIYRFDAISDPLGLLATMLNLPLHYRNFFNRSGVKSNIFLIYSTNDSVNNYRFIGSYDQKHKLLKENNPAVRDTLEHNVELMATICPYLPGIYLKRGTVEPTVIAYSLIDSFVRKGLDIPTFYVTSTDYAFQLPAILKNVWLVYKRMEKNQDKETNEDKSFIVDHANALSFFILKNKNVDVRERQYRLPNQPWVSPFMVLAGLACRSIKSMCTFKQALDVLNRIQDDYGVMTPDAIYDAYRDTVNRATVCPKEEVYQRYCAIDLDYQLKLYRQMPESLEYTFLNDLNDPQALYDIMNLYFNGANTVNVGML